MSIHEIEERLAEAQARLEKAAKALAPKHQGGEWEEYESAYEALLLLEWELAAAKGEEYAVPLDFPVKWDTGAPLPHLIRNDYKTFLTFYVRAEDPAWDDTYVTVNDPGSGSVESLALALAVAAFLTLFYFKKGMVVTRAGAVLAGMIVFRAVK